MHGTKLIGERGHEQGTRLFAPRKKDSLYSAM